MPPQPFGTPIEPESSAVGRYLLRCPVSLERFRWTPGSKTLFYQVKVSHDDTFASDPRGRPSNRSGGGAQFRFTLALAS
jgi:hypothetical protein